jgi:hypothetical protein
MTNGTEGFQPSNVTLNWTSTYDSFIFHRDELRFFHNVFVSSNWTQRIKSLVNFITYFEPPYLLDYNYIVVPLPIGFFVSAYLNGEGVQEFLALFNRSRNKFFNMWTWLTTPNVNDGVHYLFSKNCVPWESKVSLNVNIKKLILKIKHIYFLSV